MRNSERLVVEAAGIEPGIEPSKSSENRDSED
jgi:hypothetical protein